MSGPPPLRPTPPHEGPQRGGRFTALEPNDSTRLARDGRPRHRPPYLSPCGSNRALVSLMDRVDSSGATSCPLCADVFGERPGRGTNDPAGCRGLPSEETAPGVSVQAKAEIAAARSAQHSWRSGANRPSPTGFGGRPNGRDGRRLSKERDQQVCKLWNIGVGESLARAQKRGPEVWKPLASGTGESLGSPRSTRPESHGGSVRLQHHGPDFRRKSGSPCV